MASRHCRKTQYNSPVARSVGVGPLATVQRTRRFRNSALSAFRRTRGQPSHRPVPLPATRFPRAYEKDIERRHQPISHRSRTLNRQRITEFFEESHDPTRLLDGPFNVLRTFISTEMPGYTVFTPREWIWGCRSQFRVMPGLRLRKRLVFVGVTNHHLPGVSLTLTGRREVNQSAKSDCGARGSHAREGSLGASELRAPHEMDPLPRDAAGLHGTAG